MNNKYKIRIDQVIQYIESNLSNKISLTEVANVSHFSAYHFHRIFTGIIGETVNDYIVRRRLERAINLLIFKTELSITRVALESSFREWLFVKCQFFKGSETSFWIQSIRNTKSK